MDWLYIYMFLLQDCNFNNQCSQHEKYRKNLFFVVDGKSVTIITNITISLANYLRSPVRVLLRVYSFDTEFVYTAVKLATQIPTTNLTLLDISDSKFIDNSGVNIELQNGV